MSSSTGPHVAGLRVCTGLRSCPFRRGRGSRSAAKSTARGATLIPYFAPARSVNSHPLVFRPGTATVASATPGTDNRAANTSPTCRTRLAEHRIGLAATATLVGRGSSRPKYGLRHHQEATRDHLTLGQHDRPATRGNQGTLAVLLDTCLHVCADVAGDRLRGWPPAPSENPVRRAQ
jgi:hypothetical protein